MRAVGIVVLTLALAGCPGGSVGDSSPLAVASGTFAANPAGLAPTWDLEYDESQGLCLMLKTSLGGTSSVGCGGDVSLMRQSLNSALFTPTVTFDKEGSILFGLATDKVRTLRVEFKSGPPSVVDVISKPQTSMRFFVLQMPLLKEIPTVVALDAQGRILRRDDRPGTMGSPNLIPKRSS